MQTAHNLILSTPLLPPHVGHIWELAPSSCSGAGRRRRSPHQGSARPSVAGQHCLPAVAALAATSAPQLISRARARPSDDRISDRDPPAVTPSLAPPPPFPRGVAGCASPDLRSPPTSGCRRGRQRWWSEALLEQAVMWRESGGRGA
jgi:hypothetical protein